MKIRKIRNGDNDDRTSEKKKITPFDRYFGHSNEYTHKKKEVHP